MENIFIYTGEVHSGKTTLLSELSSTLKNVSGILQPVINGQRYIKNIKTGEVRLLEINSDADDNYVYKVGSYTFNKETFNWAQKIIEDSFSEANNFIFIDEVGELEIQGKGLEPAIGKIIKYAADNSSVRIIFVVRIKLLKKFIHHYFLSLPKKNICNSRDELKIIFE